MWPIFGAKINPDFSFWLLTHKMLWLTVVFFYICFLFFVFLMVFSVLFQFQGLTFGEQWTKYFHTTVVDSLNCQLLGFSLCEASYLTQFSLHTSDICGTSTPFKPLLLSSHPHARSQRTVWVSSQTLPSNLSSSFQSTFWYGCTPSCHSCPGTTSLVPGKDKFCPSG